VRYVTEELGLDVGLDHRAADFPDKLRAAAPNGIDIYFENVGGHVWDAVFPLLNKFARVPVCGLIAHYNDIAPPEGIDRTPSLMRSVLNNRLTIQGFIVLDFDSQIDDFLRDVGGWLKAGKLKYREDVVHGLEKAPEALIGLLKGQFWQAVGEGGRRIIDRVTGVVQARQSWPRFFTFSRLRNVASSVTATSCPWGCGGATRQPRAANTGGVS